MPRQGPRTEAEKAAKREQDRRYRERNREKLRERHREEQRRYVAKNRERLNAEKRGWRKRLRPDPTGPSFNELLRSNDLYAAALAAVPRGLPDFVRDDAVADLCLGVLDGEFTIAEMPKHVRAIVARNRGATSRFAEVSLDEVIRDDGKRFTVGHKLGIY